MNWRPSWLTDELADAVIPQLEAGYVEAGNAMNDGAGSRVDVCLANIHPFTGYSGAGTRFRRYAPGLRSRGVDLRVFSGAGADCGVPVGELLAPECIEGLPVRSVVLPPGRMLAKHRIYWKALTRYCQDPRTRPDVVQLFALPVVGLLGMLRLKRLGIPLLFAHTIMMAHHPGVLRHQRQKLYWSSFLRLMTRVVTSTEVMRESLERTGTRTPIDVVPNGVDLERFRPARSEEERNETRRRLHLDPADEVVAFVGPIDPRKGPDLLLEAFGSLVSRHPRALALLVGPRSRRGIPEPAGWRKRLAELTEQSGAGERVRFVGEVQNVEEYLRAADIFVFPSVREGMGNAVLEAYASGLASVLVPFIGLSAEHGRSGVHYLLADRSARSLASCIETLLRDPRRRESIGAEARALVERTLGIESVLDRFAGLYRDVSLGARGVREYR